jgi:hypothetical protein
MRPDDPGAGDPNAAPGDGRAPLLGTWRRWYVLVLGTMIALTAVFAALSSHYR